MKAIFISLIAIVLAVIGWQRLHINRLQAEVSPNPEGTDSPRQHLRASPPQLPPLPDLPKRDATPSRHRAYLIDLLDPTQPAFNAHGVAAWAQTLASPEQFAVALQALLEADQSHEEGSQLIARFGPALFKQWGKIDPQGAMEAWKTLGEDIHKDPLRDALLETWAIYHSEDLVGIIPELPKPMIRPALINLATAHPDKAVTYLEGVIKPIKVVTYLEGAIKSVNLEDAPEDQQPDFKDPTHVMVAERIVDSLLQEHGSLEAALASLDSRPSSPTRKLLELPLLMQIAGSDEATPELTERAVRQFAEMPFTTRSWMTGPILKTASSSSGLIDRLAMALPPTEAFMSTLWEAVSEETQQEIQEKMEAAPR